MGINEKCLLDLKGRDYNSLNLRCNPFPSIPLCNYNEESTFFLDTLEPDIERLFNMTLQIIESKKPYPHIFIDSMLGIGKSTLLLNFCRYINNMKTSDSFAIYTIYPPSWGIYKLYQYSLNWIGFEKFVKAYTFGKKHFYETRNLVDEYFLSKTGYFQREPYHALSSLLHTRASHAIGLMMASLVELLRISCNHKYTILAIDNIEHVWKYLSSYRKSVFMNLLYHFLSTTEGNCIIVMPAVPIMKWYFEDWYPEISHFAISLGEHHFNLHSHTKAYASKVIKNYLSKGRLYTKGKEDMSPFTNEAVDRIITSNAGIISGILLDAFNLLELALNKGKKVIDFRFVRKYYSRFRG